MPPPSATYRYWAPVRPTWGAPGGRHEHRERVSGTSGGGSAEESAPPPSPFAQGAKVTAGWLAHHAAQRHHRRRGAPAGIHKVDTRCGNGHGRHVPKRGGVVRCPGQPGQRRRGLHHQELAPLRAHLGAHHGGLPRQQLTPQSARRGAPPPTQPPRSFSHSRRPPRRECACAKAVAAAAPPGAARTRLVPVGTALGAVSSRARRVSTYSPCRSGPALRYTVSATNGPASVPSCIRGGRCPGLERRR